MTNDISLSAEQTNLDDLLSRRVVLTVPDFQRTYSWKREQFQELWNDIRNKMKDDEIHHLDQIIIVPNKDRQPTREQVIDGQQRLTTLSILLCAMRDEYDERLGEDNSPSDVIDDFLKTKDLDGNQIRLLQLLSESDDDGSYAAVYNRNAEQAGGQIKEAYDFYRDKLTGLEKDKIDEIRKYVQNQLTFIRTEVGELVHAYVMFETTNSRGMDLSALEMTKAILMRMAHRGTANEEQVRNLWLEILETARSIDKGKPTRPIKDILAVSEDYSAPTELSGKQFVGHIRTVFDDETVMQDLKYIDENIERYKIIKTARVDRFSRRKNAKINSQIKQFKAKNPNAGIILYWLFENFDSPDKIMSALDLGIILNVRLTLSDKAAWQKRDAMHSVYNQIESGEPVEQVFKGAIREETPNDEALKIELRDFQFKNNDLTRYILYRLEADHFGGPAVKNTNYPAPGEDFEIEHIAPMQAMSADKYTSWNRVFNHNQKRFEGTERKRIGNLTLLRNPQNIEAGTDPFAEKAEIYKQSDFAMSIDVAEKYDEWGFEQIKNRSEDMAGFIVDSFSIEDKQVIETTPDGGRSLKQWMD